MKKEYIYIYICVCVCVCVCVGGGRVSQTNIKVCMEELSELRAEVP